MADYWKSQPKKFCQYCKCWIADNKPSIEFHERGKNHKQNVAAKIEEIKKKSIDKAKQEDRQSKEFAAMEEAALKAYEEDMKRLQTESGASQAEPQTKAEQPKQQTKTQKVKSGFKAGSNRKSHAWVESLTDDGHVYYYNTETEESQWDKPEGFQGQSASVAPTKQQTESGSPWMEALSPDGYTYYYNTETGESSWEKPADFPSEGSSSAAPGEGEEEEPSPPKPEPLSEEENSSNGAKASVETEEPKQTKVPKISFRKRKEEKPKTPGKEEEEVKEESEEDLDAEAEEEESSGDASGPDPVKEEKAIPAKKPRINPYGAWEQIQEEEDPYENVDLQLPQVDTGGAAPVQTELPPEPKPKFRERTITSLGDEGGAGATFRKRKTENGKSRSLRKRGKDD